MQQVHPEPDAALEPALLAALQHCLKPGSLETMPEDTMHWLLASQQRDVDDAPPARPPPEAAAPPQRPPRFDDRPPAQQQAIDKATADLQALLKTTRAGDDIDAAVDDFLERVEVPAEDHVLVVKRMMRSWAELEKKVRKSDVMAMSESLVITYVDFFTDGNLVHHYWKKGKIKHACVVGGILVVSNVAQGLFAVVMKQPWYMFLAGLFGAAPFVHTCREALGMRRFRGQKLSNEMMLLYSRMIEAMFEASPQVRARRARLLFCARQARGARAHMRG